MSVWDCTMLLASCSTSKASLRKEYLHRTKPSFCKYSIPAHHVDLSYTCGEKEKVINDARTEV